ncbi:hypothetical protein ABK040_002770 [Willaertia magna]
MQKNHFFSPHHFQLIIPYDKWQEWTFPPNCKTIKGLAGGAYFSAFYNEFNEIYMLGKNDKINNNNLIKITDIWYKLNNCLNEKYEIKNLFVNRHYIIVQLQNDKLIINANTIINQFQKIGIKYVTCGPLSNTFIVVDKNDQIFNVIFDNVVKLDSKEITTTIKCIGCSDNSFILVTIDNKMFGYGNNQFNVQLGLYSTDKFNYIITPFEKESEIMDVKCGYYHTVVLLKNGTFYVCGYNNLGQTNVYNQVNVPRFTKLTHPLFENEFITKIYCSSRGTVLITKL